MNAIFTQRINKHKSTGTLENDKEGKRVRERERGFYLQKKLLMRWENSSMELYRWANREFHCMKWFCLALVGLNYLEFISNIDIK